MPPKIVGYSRIASGCDYCLVAAGNLYRTDQLMPIHEHCTCGVEPVFEDSNDPRSFHAPDHALPDSELGARIDQTADITAQVEELNATKPLVWEPGKMSVEDFLAKGGKLEDLPKGLRPKPVEAAVDEHGVPLEPAKGETVDVPWSERDRLEKLGWEPQGQVPGGSGVRMKFTGKVTKGPKTAQKSAKKAFEPKPDSGRLEYIDLENALDESEVNFYGDARLGADAELGSAVDQAISDYIGSDSFKINGALRGLATKKTEAKYADTIKAMDKAFRPLPADIRTFRGVSDTFENVFGAKPEVGGIIEDKGFVSTSADPQVASDFGSNGAGTIFDIETDAGHPAVYLGSGESEIILPRGTMFEITKVERVEMADEATGEVFIGDRITVRTLPREELKPVEAVKKAPKTSEALSAEEVDAISSYATGEGAGINAELRGVKSLVHSKPSKNLTAEMDAAMEKQVLTKDTTLYRGLGSGAYDLSEGQLAAGDVEHLVGGVWADPGYMSTSADINEAADISAIHRGLRLSADKPNVVVMEIRAKAGQHAVDINKTLGDKSPFPAQEEQLLPRDTHVAITGVRTQVTEDWTITIVEGEIT